MSVREYVGARYVPIVVGEWDNSKTYEPLMVVTYQGASYTSRQYVPAGIAITDEKFWVLSANYNAQVDAYRNEVQALDGRITANANAIETETANRTAAVTAEMERAQSAEQTLQTNIDTEKTRAESAEQTLQSTLDKKADEEFAFEPFNKPAPDDVQKNKTALMLNKGPVAFFSGYNPNVPFNTFKGTNTSTTEIAAPDTFPTYGYHDIVGDSRSMECMPYKAVIPENGVISINDTGFVCDASYIDLIAVGDSVQLKSIDYPYADDSAFGLVSDITDNKVTVDNWRLPKGSTSSLPVTCDIYINPVNGFYSQYTVTKFHGKASKNAKLYGHEYQFVIEPELSDFRYAIGIGMYCDKGALTAGMRIYGNDSTPIVSGMEFKSCSHLLESLDNEKRLAYILYPSGRERIAVGITSKNTFDTKKVLCKTDTGMLTVNTSDLFTENGEQYEYILMNGAIRFNNDNNCRIGGPNIESTSGQSVTITRDGYKWAKLNVLVIKSDTVGTDILYIDNNGGVVSID